MKLDPLYEFSDDHRYWLEQRRLHQQALEKQARAVGPVQPVRSAYIHREPQQRSPSKAVELYKILMAKHNQGE